jgi:16S rRNA (guanine527-N7)-methyltransferase
MERLIAAVKQVLNLDLSTTQIAAFNIYARELAEWNEKFNLTAIRNPADVEIKHFADSVSCLGAMRLFNNGASANSLRMVDVGTGAGFPSLPLKIMCPEMRLTLVESVGKKVTFLNHMVEVLKLKDVEVVQGRAEDLGRETAHRERYDWAVARAVAEMRTLLEYLLPLVKKGGKVLAQKGESAPAEAQAAEHAAKLLGGTLEKIMPVELPGVVEARYLVVFGKVSATPQRYPRRTGLPGKEPLG